MGNTFASKALRCSRFLKEGDQTLFCFVALQHRIVRNGLEKGSSAGKVMEE